ncbi:MAG: heme-binding domain-containing protein [Panacibacter sp.]
MSSKKKILLLLLLLFIAMQFIQPARNKSSIVQQADMIRHFTVPANAARILKTSCYDCHSNNTPYPWYANIQPIGWLLAKHIRDGKRELNFSDFATYSQRRQLSKLKAIANSIKDGSMPLASYTLLHGDAKLSDSSKQQLIEWALKIKDSVEAGHKADE